MVEESVADKKFAGKGMNAIMSKDWVETALTVVEKSSKTIIGSVDAEGFPNLKAMLKPREHDGLNVFYFTTNTSSAEFTL